MSTTDTLPPETPAEANSGGGVVLQRLVTPHPYYQDDAVTLYHGDIRTHWDILPKCNLVLTDPPYPDEFKWCWPMLGELAAEKLVVGGSLLTLCGHYQVLSAGAAIEQHLRFWWIAGMHQTSITRMIGKDVNINWKPILWFVKDTKRKDVSTRWPQDMFSPRKREKGLYEWQQSESLFCHWIEELTNPGEMILEPFVGSGTTLAAAKLLGRKCVGVEMDEGRCEITAQRLSQGVFKL